MYYKIIIFFVIYYKLPWCKIDIFHDSASTDDGLVHVQHVDWKRRQ